MGEEKNLRIKYKRECSGNWGTFTVNVIMSVSFVEIYESSTEDHAALIFEDMYSDGGYVLLGGITLHEVLMLQDEIFRTGVLDLSQRTVEEVGICDDDEEN